MGKTSFAMNSGGKLYLESGRPPARVGFQPGDAGRKPDHAYAVIDRQSRPNPNAESASS